MKNTEERIKTLQNQMLLVIVLILVITIICNCLLAINNKLTARVEVLEAMVQELEEQTEYLRGDYAIEDKWLQVKINILKKNIDDLRAGQDVYNGKSE